MRYVQITKDPDGRLGLHEVYRLQVADGAYFFESVQTAFDQWVNDSRGGSVKPAIVLASMDDVEFTEQGIESRFEALLRVRQSMHRRLASAFGEQQ